MALECGTCLHEVFAAVRIWQLHHVQKLEAHAAYTGKRIFGQARWNKCWKHSVSHTEERESLTELCFSILATAGWKDDDNDRVRTMTNMELSTIAYIDERLYGFQNWPIYVEDEKNPQSMVGIEQVFDVVLTFEDGKEYRYAGTIDGCIIKAATNVHYLDENKTSVRLSAAWRESFEMKHQVTGYCAASTAVFGFKILRSRVTGLKIPPTHKGEDCYPFEPMERTEDAIQHWATWLREYVDTYERYKDDFEHATRNTHSCSRFFRTCSLLQFCADTAEGRQVAFNEWMVPADPSPTERAIGE